MKELSFPTKIYLGSMYISGIIVMAWQVNQYEYKIPWMLFLLCGLASIGLILKVEGATSRSHYI
jgi:hypothetical protein